MSEGSLVSYWEKFGAVAFDGSMKAIMTTCVVKCSSSNSAVGVHPASRMIECCFSFTIQRDSHNMLVITRFHTLC